MDTIRKEPYLPRCVRKKELKHYFGESLEFIWSHIITDELLEEWGTSYEAIKPLRALPAELPERIYLHFKIRDLNEAYYQQIVKMMEEG